MINFFGEGRARNLLKKLKDKDLLPVGFFRTNKTDQPQPDTRAISYADFRNNLKKEIVCDLDMSEGIELGPVVSFTKTDYGSEVDVIIPGELEITRGDARGIFNIAVEPYFDNAGYTSPADTEWASLETDPSFDVENYGNYPNFNYGYWVDSRDFSNWPDPGLVGPYDFVMHHIPSDRYWIIKFTQWTQGGEGPAGGGFSYTRQEVVVPDCKITFPDGSTMKTAPVPTQICGFPLTDVLPEDTVTICRQYEGDIENYSVPVSSFSGGANTWDVRNVAFLSTFGNDSTAVVGDGNKPYRTFSAAQTAASVIFVKDGSWGTETIVSNKTIYFYPGTQMYRMRDGGATVTNTKVLGHLKFRSFGYGIELTGSGSDISVECDEFDNTRSIAFIFNGSTCKIKTRKAFANGFNGGAYACAVRDGATLELTVTESLTLYYWVVATRGAANNFILRCPDVRIIPGGNYGSTPFGSLVNYQGSITQGGSFLVDFMGGKLTRTKLQGSSFGVRDSALLLAVNCYGGNPTPIIKFQNGFVDAGSSLGILIEYIVLRIHCELNNIQLKTTSKPIELSQRAVNIGGWTEFCNFIARNCSFEGDLDNELGNCRIARFFDCNFKTLTGASNFIFNNSNGASPGEAYFVNCNAELVGGPGEMLTGFTGKTIGLLNTYSDEVIGVGAVDTWGGHSTIPTLTLPNLES